VFEKAIKKSFLIQIDALNFAEFKISEFEISRVDCNMTRFLSAWCQINLNV